MAVTGSGTQADPWIVHSYDEFMSTKSIPTGDGTFYVKFFDTPNQTIDCNTYGSEFKWHQYDTSHSGTWYIDLNGCTIKNFLIADGEAMFPGYYTQWIGNRTFYISNGSFRNVFLGSATSKFCTNYVHFQDVSISFNFAGATVTPFEGNGDVTFDNCAMYLVGSTLQAPIITTATLTDTDIELHIGNQNNKTMFQNSTLTDCRLTGKVSGVGQTFEYNTDTCVLDWCGMNSKTLNFTNCVVDLDLTDGRIAGYNFGGSKYDVFLAYNGANFNTNVVCNSHRPIDEGHEQYYGRETAWNFMSHENIRNGAYLNNAGFTVVEVVDGD